MIVPQSGLRNIQGRVVLVKANGSFYFEFLNIAVLAVEEGQLSEEKKNTRRRLGAIKTRLQEIAVEKEKTLGALHDLYKDNVTDETPAVQAGSITGRIVGGLKFKLLG